MGITPTCPTVNGDLIKSRDVLATTALQKGQVVTWYLVYMFFTSLVYYVSSRGWFYHLQM